MKYILIPMLLFFTAITFFAQVSTQNPSYLHQIDSLVQIDQKVRKPKFRQAAKYYHKHKHAPKYTQTKRFKKAERLTLKWQETDALVIKSLLKLVQKNGFPSEARVGPIGYQLATVIFLHFDRDINNKVLAPILHQALLNQEINPLDYAQILDRHLVNNGMEPIYYTWNYCQFPMLSENRKKEILDARHRIGLYGFSMKCGAFKKRIVIEKPKP